LLDGLDEVAVEHRAQCVETLNGYLNEWPNHPLAICARLREYEETRARLSLRAAVRIEPLEMGRAQEVIAGPEYAGVRTVCDREGAFREMLTVPFLLNLIRTAYKGQTAEQLTLPAAGNLETARRDNLFECYIERRLGEADVNSAKRKPPFYRRKVRRWLSWLADSMQRRDQSIFYLESLQGSWLPTPVQRSTFVIVGSLAFGALIGGFGGSVVESSYAFTSNYVPEGVSLSMSLIGSFIFLYGAIAQLGRRPLACEWGQRASSLRALVINAAITFATFLAFGLIYIP
jgi:hypothetical protein